MPPIHLHIYHLLRSHEVSAPEPRARKYTHYRNRRRHEPNLRKREIILIGPLDRVDFDDARAHDPAVGNEEAHIRLPGEVYGSMGSIAGDDDANDHVAVLGEWRRVGPMSACW